MRSARRNSSFLAKLRFRFGMHSVNLSLAPDRLQQLQSQLSARRERKERQDARALSNAVRRRAQDEMAEQRNQQFIADNAQRMTNNSQRAREQQMGSEARARSAGIAHAAGRERALEVQHRMQIIHDGRAEAAVQRTNRQSLAAGQTRSLLLEGRVGAMRAADSERTRRVEEKRAQLELFEGARVSHAIEAVAAKQSLMIARDTKLARERNLQFEARREKASVIRQRCDAYHTLHVQRGLERLERVPDRLATVVETRQQAASARREAHHDRAARAASMMQRVDALRQAQGQCFLNRFEEAKLVGELTRAYQQQRV